MTIGRQLGVGSCLLLSLSFTVCGRHRGRRPLRLVRSSASAAAAERGGEEAPGAGKAEGPAPAAAEGPAAAPPRSATPAAAAQAAPPPAMVPPTAAGAESAAPATPQGVRSASTATAARGAAAGAQADDAAGAEAAAAQGRRPALRTARSRRPRASPPGQAAPVSPDKLPPPAAKARRRCARAGHGPATAGARRRSRRHPPRAWCRRGRARAASMRCRRAARSASRASAASSRSRATASSSSRTTGPSSATTRPSGSGAARARRRNGGPTASSPPSMRAPTACASFTEVDAHGRLVRRYRRGPDGREHTSSTTAGSCATSPSASASARSALAILNMAPPRVTIPREKYIVDYERASDDDLYEALDAPPIERLERAYSLEEIRDNYELRQRLRAYRARQHQLRVRRLGSHARSSIPSSSAWRARCCASCAATPTRCS